MRVGSFKCQQRQAAGTYLTLLSDDDRQLIEVVAGWLAGYKYTDSGVVDGIDVEGERADCCSHHAIAVVNELDGLRVQWERGMLAIILHNQH